MTKKKVTALANKLGATIEESLIGNAGLIEAIAPDGYLWDYTDSLILVNHWRREFKGHKAEEWRDIYKRMEYGLRAMTDEELHEYEMN